MISILIIAFYIFTKIQNFVSRTLFVARIQREGNIINHSYYSVSPVLRQNEKIYLFSIIRKTFCKLYKDDFSISYLLFFIHNCAKYANEAKIRNLFCPIFFLFFNIGSLCCGDQVIQWPLHTKEIYVHILKHIAYACIGQTLWYKHKFHWYIETIRLPWRITLEKF